MKVLAIDIGGTLIKYTVIDKDGNIDEIHKTKTPLDKLDSLIDVIENIYNQYDDVLGIALSMPGNIDSKTGHIDTPGMLTYNHNTNIIKNIKARIDVKVSVENDGNAAAFAELWHGNLSDVDSGIVLVLGTGIGGAIVQNREIIKGNHFFAGEVSFMMSDLHDFGMHNAFAVKASTTALISATERYNNLEINTLDGYKVFEMIEDNNPGAMQSFDEMTQALATQIYNLQCLLDPQRILIGGGISRQNILLETIQSKLESFYEAVPFPMPHANVDTCRYFNASNLMGAAYHFFKTYNLI